MGLCPARELWQQPPREFSQERFAIVRIGLVAPDRQCFPVGIDGRIEGTGFAGDYQAATFGTEENLSLAGDRATIV